MRGALHWLSRQMCWTFVLASGRRFRLGYGPHMSLGSVELPAGLETPAIGQKYKLSLGSPHLWFEPQVVFRVSFCWGIACT